ncbi:MAG: IS66 family insertion sequence element accessory protein TnpB [Roseovarius sp.]|jgi:transposase|nr:IS66 family insertion sequence element accessory protein TnpB [Roseovarius sp.]
MKIKPEKPVLKRFSGFYEVNFYQLSPKVRFYRRLEEGKFEWPAQGDPMTAISRRELRWLLDGLQLRQKKAHREVTARTVL